MLTNEEYLAFDLTPPPQGPQRYRYLTAALAVYDHADHKRLWMEFPEKANDGTPLYMPQLVEVVPLKPKSLLFGLRPALFKQQGTRPNRFSIREHPARPTRPLFEMRAAKDADHGWPVGRNAWFFEDLARKSGLVAFGMTKVQVRAYANTPTMQVLAPDRFVPPNASPLPPDGQLQQLRFPDD